MDVKKDSDVAEDYKIFYDDYPEVEMIFICNGPNVMELRKRGDSLSLNALTASLGWHQGEIDILIRGVSKDGIMYSPLIGTIVQRLKTQKIPIEKARELATKWAPLNPYVKKHLIAYSLLEEG